MNDIPASERTARPAFLAGGSELGALVAAFDWGNTPLGRIETWPPSLKTAAGIVLHSPVPMVLLWGEDGIMIYNDAYSAFAGGRHPRLLGSKVREGWPEVADFNDNVMKVGLAGGTLAYRDQELTLYRSGRPEQVWMNLDYSPVLDEGGRPAGVLAVVIETTERVRAERARDAAEARAASVLEGMAEGFVLLDRDFRVLAINAEGLRMEQRPREAILGRIHWEAWPGSEESELGRLYKKAMREDVPVSLEHRYVWPDARQSWIEMRAYPSKDGLAIFYREVTDRKRAERRLLESEEHYRHTVELNPQVAWTATPDGQLDRVAERWQTWTGTTGLGETWGQGLHPDDLGATIAAWTRSVTTGVPYDVEHRVKMLAGGYRWARSRAFPRRDEAGRIVKWYGTTEDVHERRRADEALRRNETALRENEAKFQAIANSIDQMIWSTQPDGYHDYYNDRWYQYTGVPPGSTDGEAWNGMFHPDDQERAWAVWQHSLATGEPYHIEYRLRHRSGQYRWVLGRAQCVRDDEGRITRWFGTCTDIHDLKVAEDRQAFLLALNDRLRNAADPIAATLAAVEALGRHVRVPRAGYGDIDAAGEVVKVERDWTRDDSVASLAGEARILDGFGPAVVAELKAGRTLVVEDCYADPRAGKAYAETWDSIGCRALIVVPIVRDRGLRAILYLHEPRPRRWTAAETSLAEDVAERSWDAAERARVQEELRELNRTLEERIVQRTAELESAQEALRQAQKMEAVGQLTGGIAHDFNNMLAVVIGSLDLLGRRFGDAEPRARRYIDAATDGARRAALLTQRLLAFSRQQPLKPEPLDANKLVAGMSDLLRHSLGADTRLETVLAGGLWRTHADPNQLENVILNLAVNARDAMPEGGRLTIETQNAHLDGRYAAAHLGLPAGQYVLIAVTDTGSGMSPEVMARAFDPFFTTKEIGKGTGLGLSQVYGFLKQSGGHVKIYSEPGQGTTVKVYLPRFTASETEVSEADASADVPLGDRQEVVLLVEDEVAVRQFSVDALNELGYRVLKAEGATAALRLLEAHPEVALLFTDVVMPEVNGRKLADEARRIRPDLKVLFTTGYTRNAVVHNGVLDPGVELISKPFTLEELAAKVRQVLDSPPVAEWTAKAPR